MSTERLGIFRLIAQRKNHYEEIAEKVRLDKSYPIPDSATRLRMIDQTISELDWILERLDQNDWELENEFKNYRPKDRRSEKSEKSTKPTEEGEAL